MAVHKLIGNTFTAPANADLSAAQYKIVYMVNDGDVDLLVNNGTMPVGILLNKPAAAGRAARIAGVGEITKCVANSAIDEGQLVQATAQGFGSAAAGGTNAWYVGMAHGAASGSGAIFELAVNPGRGVQT